MPTESTVNEYGDSTDASTIFSPSSTGTGIDTPATSASSPATTGPHEHSTGMQGRNVMPISLSTSGPTPEGKIAVKQQKIINKAALSKLRRVRHGGLCPLGCGTKLTRLDHYRVGSHCISCPKYTGDREALKARYRKKRKPNQALEKEAEQASNQTNLKALSDQTIATTINRAEPATVALTQPLSQGVDLDRRALYPAVQATTVAEANVLTAMESSSPPTLDFLHSLTRDGYGNTTYSTNDMSMLQSRSYPHPDIQFATDTISIQPYWGPFDATQDPTSSNAATDRRSSEPHNSAYTQEFTDEVQTTTMTEATPFAALGLHSQATVFRSPSIPRSGNGDATYPMNTMGMLQPGLYPHPGMRFAMDTIPTQPHWDPLDATQVSTSTSAVADRRLIEHISPTYTQESNLYPAMRLCSQPTLNFHSSMARGTVLLQPGSYTNTQNSDWHSPSTASGWEQ